MTIRLKIIAVPIEMTDLSHNITQDRFSTNRNAATMDYQYNLNASKRSSHLTRNYTICLGKSYNNTRA